MAPDPPQEDPSSSGCVSGDPADKTARLEIGFDTIEHLRRQAHKIIGKDEVGSIRATMLADDAWLRLRDKAREEWSSRSHFLAAAARAMHCVLVDALRYRGAEKRNGGREHLMLVSDIHGKEESPVSVVEMTETLELLEARDPEAADLVKLKFYGGLTMSEIAQQLRVSKSTAEAMWRHAKLVLLHLLGGGDSPP